MNLPKVDIMYLGKRFKGEGHAQGSGGQTLSINIYDDDAHDYRKKPLYG